MSGVLILGASSGFGAASARAFARAGHDVFGVHLDRKSTMPLAEAVATDVEAEGRRCRMFNVNAADADRREEVLAELVDEDIGVLLHSLAFGSLRPFTGERPLQPKQLTMTLEVMAHSLVWWARGLVGQGSMKAGGRIFSMTSSGSIVVLPSYGAVSAAKAALESHTRQLAVELAPLGITANSIMAGVTDTPALQKIPGKETLIGLAARRNPGGRLTRPEDVADALVELSRPGLAWMTGNVIRIDGGEGIVA
ncbi:MAG TPA: SDR family oxidoreductase [Myxococcota bacterium]|nr:SDR family oxidoreductase [Myxococcota bacterium]